MPEKRVLVVSTELAICYSIHHSIEDIQTAFSFVFSIKNVLISLLKYDYCLVIVDLQELGDHGMELLRMMRTIKFIPVLALTAKLTSKEKVALLRAGADVHLEKPVDFDVCVAQIETLIKLYTELCIGQKDQHQIAFGTELLIYPYNREIFVDGKPLILTRKEYDLFLFLAQNPGQVWGIEQLYSHIWDNNPEIDGAGTVRAHIFNLREKLKLLGKKYIQNKWGVGYKFVPPYPSETDILL